MLVFLHVLRAQALAVVEQFHPVHVGVNPDRDVLSFKAGPVPVWEDMEHRPVGPPRLVVVEKYPSGTRRCR